MYRRSRMEDEQLDTLGPGWRPDEGPHSCATEVGCGKVGTFFHNEGSVNCETIPGPVPRSAPVPASLANSRFRWLGCLPNRMTQISCATI